MNSDTNIPTTIDYYLKPGYIFVPDQPTTISTVLGSSVAVSLYDRSLKLGGMSHFLFPFTQAKEKTTARYGNIAILALIKMVTNVGGAVSNLEAQIFGGAFNPEFCQRDIGRDNLGSARQALIRKNIRIASEDVGGELGRKIVFNTTTCEIVVLKVDRLRESDWFPYSGDR